MHFLKAGGCIAVLLSGLLNIATAQTRYYTEDSSTTPEKGFQKEKLFYGGNLGLSFGSLTYINVSPLIGYRFSDLFAAGLQVNGLYESARYRDYNNITVRKERFGMVGLGAFGRIYPIPQIFLQLQPEMNYTIGKTLYYDTQPPTEVRNREWVPALLGGVGYAQPTGRSNSFVIMILYDILQDDHSPYGSKPIFRAGVNIGF